VSGTPAGVFHANNNALMYICIWK